MLNPSILQAVERANYRVTVGDVAAQAGLELNLAQQGLLALASETGGNLQVAETGDIVYLFPTNFRGILRNKFWQLRLQESWSKIWRVLFYLIRISFGIVLILSIILIFVALMVAVVVITSSGQKSDGDRGGSSSDNNGGGLNFFSIFRIWYWVDFGTVFHPGYGYETRPRPRRRRDNTDDNSMNFLEAVYSFLFGDGNPNFDLEERRWQAIGAVIRNQQGAIIAQQIAPYFDELSPVALEDESYILPVLARFNGYPQVSDRGELVYYFPDLQVTAQTQEYQAIPPYLPENTWKFSEASGGQIAGAITLGIVNFVGALALGYLLKTNPDVYFGEFVSFVASIYGVLLVYGSSFLAIPLVRYLWVKGKNQQIQQRNEQRQERLQVLAQPDEVISHKLDYARQFASQKVIDDRDLAYTTETDVIDQELAQKDKLDQAWERRLEEGKNG